MKIDQQEQKDNKSMKKITRRDEDYSKWYSEVISSADLAEHAPVRGCMIIKPNGYAIWEIIQKILDKMFKDRNVENAYFPLFIPEEFLQREAKHIEGFSPELAVVTHAGGKKLEEPLVVRPTSETIIYESFSKWINSYRDLPVLINQWANVVRWEMRPRLFLRTSEFLWQEGHTAHKTAKEAEDYTLMILLDVYKKFVEEYLAIPVYSGIKSEKEKFAGALNTYCIEALMQDGKSLQAGTAHDLSSNFAKSFNVKFLNEQGNSEYVYQTSWGVSTRLIGGLIMAHSDDNGLVLPPKIAPIQIVIIPICNSIEDPAIKEAEKIKEILSKFFSVKIDLRINLRPGEKYYEWEKKGIPVRIEIGPKDLQNSSCVVVRRDNSEKESVKIDDILKRIEFILDDIQNSLFEKAKRRRAETNTKVDRWEDFEKCVEKGGYIFAHWCEDSDCEAQIKEKTKATTRCLLFEAEDETGEHFCVHCGKKAKGKRWIFAKAY